MRLENYSNQGRRFYIEHRIMNFELHFTLKFIIHYSDGKNTLRFRIKLATSGSVVGAESTLRD